MLSDMELFPREVMRAPGGAEMFIGPAGWSYPDWKGIVYPKPQPRGFRAPTYLAQFFNTIEVNSTFYRPPTAANSRRWVDDVRSQGDFLYTAKLWRRFTHDRAPRWSDADVETFRTGLAPLVEAGRLGALLVQFPYSFHPTRGNRSYLADLVATFDDLPLVVEVRSRDWLAGEMPGYIASLGVGFCNVDQPQIGGNLPLTSETFGPTGYLRLHGRNTAAWFAEDAGRDQRYDYLYNERELDELQKVIEDATAQVERMFVIANNHYRGQAVAAGLQLMNRLTGRYITPPGSVGELYGL